MNGRLLAIGFALGTALGLTACGTTPVTSLKEFSPADGAPKIAFVDIKQRAVLSAARKSSGSTATEIVTCAEPSPDALSSIAYELSLEAKARDNLQAALGLSQQEAASFVGLRTQTIQLLRDGMYRLCEGYMSGALTAADFAWLSRRYQRNMVALLTIEQLTRVAQVPVVAQASQGLAAAARSAIAIEADLEQVDKRLAQLADERKKISSEKSEAEKLPDGDDKTKKLKDIQQRLDDNQSAINRAGEVRAALLEGLKSAKGLLASGSTTVQVLSGSGENLGKPSTEVVKAIEAITTQVLNQDDLPTLCFQLLDGSRPTPSSEPKLKSKCLTVIENRAALDKALLEVLMKKLAAAENQDELLAAIRDLGSRFQVMQKGGGSGVTEFSNLPSEARPPATKRK